LVSEAFAHNPKSVLSKNFGGLPLSAWDNIPPGELFIFPGTKAPTDISKQNIVGSAGLVPKASSYSYHASLAQNTHESTGGSVKVIDPTVFPIASKFSAAVVTIKPGAVREIHWHTTSDEWNFFIAGSARIGIYVCPFPFRLSLFLQNTKKLTNRNTKAAQGNARTFDYHAGDTGYIPKAMTHYVENTGSDDVIFIEVLQADHFSGTESFSLVFPFLPSASYYSSLLIT
jgi:oxalate decarboxylase/phosphoglucose isomerase-like protein (cupin superfamily)